MTSGNEADLRIYRDAIFAARTRWLLVLLIPLSLGSCYGGIFLGSGMVTHPNIALKAAGAAIMLLALGSLFWWLGLVKFFCTAPARAALQKVMQMERSVADRAIAMVGGPNCYYNVAMGSSGGGVAINPATGQAALIVGMLARDTTPKLAEISLSGDDIVGYSALQAGLVQEDVFNGRDGVQMLRAAERNLKARMRQAQATGLHILTRDIRFPEVFINFDYQTAKAWVMLLDRWRDQSLPSPEAPTVYPLVDTK